MADTSETAEASFRDLFRGAHRPIVFAGLGASFLAAFDILIVATALPSIARDVHGIEHYALALGAYSVATAIGLPLAGGLSDRYGAFRTLLSGCVLFVIGTVISGSASTMEQVAAGRFVQGLAGGFLLSVPILLWTAYLPRHLTGYAFAVNAAVWGISALLGPPVGAVLTSQLSWPYVFWINLPILAVIVLFAVRGLAHAPRPVNARRRINVLGPLLLGVGTLALLLAPLAAIVPLVLFAIYELRTDVPLIPRHPSGYAATAIALATGIAFTGGGGYLNLSLQSGSGWSVGQAAIPLLGASIAWVIGSGLVNRLDWTLRKAIAVGAALVGGGVVLGAIPVAGGVLAAAGFTVAGLGMGLSSPALFQAVLSDTPGREGSETTAVTTGRQVGASIGAALGGLVLNAEVPRAILQAAEDGRSPLPELHQGAATVFLVLGLCTLASLPFARGLRLQRRAVVR